MKNKLFPMRFRLGLLVFAISLSLMACQKHQDKPWQYFGDNTAETQSAPAKTQAQATP